MPHFARSVLWRRWRDGWGKINSGANPVFAATRNIGFICSPNKGRARGDSGVQGDGLVVQRTTLTLLTPESKLTECFDEGS